MTHALALADLREVRGVQMHRLVMYFCVHLCTSPSNDFTAVACSNNQHLCDVNRFNHGTMYTIIVTRIERATALWANNAGEV